MYKLSETRDKKSMSEPAPLGPGFQAAKLEKADHMEVWGSGFSDPGADYCEFRLFDAEGQKIASRRVEGY